MVELNKRPLKRGIALKLFYVELTESGVEIKVRGSRRPGVRLLWAEIIERATMPETRPAKIGTAMEYLDWVVGKMKRQKRSGLLGIGRHA